MLQYLKKHKIISAIVFVLIIGLGYWIYGKYTGSKVKVSYVTSAVQKGTIITSVTGSGQVSSSNQVDLKAKVSGDITKVYVTDGQVVKAGDSIVQIDATAALKAVRDAQYNLDSANLAMQKLVQPADQLTLIQAQDALTQARQAKQNAQDDLIKTYEDSYNNISNAFLNLPNIVSGLHDVIYNYSFSTSQQNIDYYTDTTSHYDNSVVQYKNDVISKFDIANISYSNNFNDYKTVDRSADTVTIESLLNQTYQTARKISDAIKSANNLIQFYQNQLTLRNIQPQTQATTQLASLNTYTGQVNTILSNLLSNIQTIKNDNDTITNSDQAIIEKTQSLEQIKAGADPLDIKSQELSVLGKRNALYDAKTALADYTVRAPFDGIVASVDVKAGDSASGITLATIITKQQIVEISLNEVDVGKVKSGMKVSLTFDAIDGLEMTGQVVDIDTLGTVSQGVVSYAVKITLDTQDDRIKTGMSVNATIITNIKTDVLSISNSAIKTGAGGSYVEMLDANGTPQSVTIQTGLTSDTDTEIIGGLKEGDKVITQTIDSSVKTTTQQSSGNAFRIPGLGGGR
jgi:HlyD family secretion protein